MKKRLKKILERIVDIFFADAKLTWERITSLCSAVFWTWLEVTFLVFFFTYAFGITGYIIGGTYEYSWEILKNNEQLIDALIKAFVIIIFITRVPIHYGKEIKK